MLPLPHQCLGIIRHQRIQIHGPHTSVPPHFGQAPWELNASSSALGACTFAPHSGHRISCSPLLSGSAAHNVRWGSDGKPDGNTSDADCSKVPCRFRRYCGSPDAGTLMQCQRCRNIEDFIHLGFRRAGHTSSGVGGQRFQITSGALRIEDAQRQ